MSEQLVSINPATEKVAYTENAETSEQVMEKITLAEEAFHTWRKTSFAERAAYLVKVAQELRHNAHEYGRYMTEEMGKPVKEALGEVEKAASCADHYAENAEKYLQTEELASDATRSYVQYMPLGPVLGILPWNAPFWLAFRFCAPALMAGNTCLMKHDPHVPACAKALVSAFEKVGLPKGVFQALFIETPKVEKAIRDPRIQAVSFTGSTRGGVQVAQIAASEIKPAVLELGGSDPCIMLEGCDIEKATDIATLSRIINAGQSCIAAKRIIVEESIYDAVVEKMKAKIAKLSMGDPTLESTDIGPLARKDLQENLHQQISATIAEGANCLLGGELPKGTGYFYPATLLTDVTEDMTAFKEETFGPVAVIIRAKDITHAMELANKTEYGLGSSIWTGDVIKAEALAKDIFAGQVAINGIVKTDPRLPSGGVKRSGYGRELGPHGIKEFVNAQQVWVGA